MMWLAATSAKIRAALDAHKTRMKHPHGFAVQRAQLLALEPLMLPNGLQQALGRGVVGITERGDRAVPAAPLGIETGGSQGHLGLLLRRRVLKVKHRNLI